MCRFLRVGVATSAIMAMAGLSAAAVDLQPGLWEISTKSERNGVTAARPTRTKCITPEQAKTLSSRTFLTVEFRLRGKICKIVDPRQTDQDMSWRMECPGLFPMVQAGRYVVDSSQHYKSELTSSVTLPGKTMNSALSIEGRRIGECPP